jgi:hypothetical protein
MKRLTSIALAVSFILTLVAPCAIAGDDKNAGETIGDSMYVDNKFGFSFLKPGTWKFEEVFDNDDIERVVLTQKSPVVPPQFTREKERYFTRPQVTILAMELEEFPKDYVEFLLSEDGKDDLKKKAYGKFQLFRQDSEYVFEKKKTRKTKVGGHHAVKVAGRKQYFYAFEDDPRPLSDFISGYVFVIGANNGIVLMEFVCEREMIRELDPDLDYIVDSFAFADEEAEEEPEMDKESEEAE